MLAKCAATALSTEVAPEPKRTSKVETTLSFAISPVKVATVDSQLPKPKGEKIKAIALPTYASKDASLLSTMLKAPFSKPKCCKNQRIIVERRITVPAFLINDQHLSQVVRRIFEGTGAW